MSWIPIVILVVILGVGIGAFCIYWFILRKRKSSNLKATSVVGTIQAEGDAVGILEATFSMQSSTETVVLLEITNLNGTAVNGVAHVVTGVVPAAFIPVTEKQIYIDVSTTKQYLLTVKLNGDITLQQANATNLVAGTFNFGTLTVGYSMLDDVSVSKAGVILNGNSVIGKASCRFTRASDTINLDLLSVTGINSAGNTPRLYAIVPLSALRPGTSRPVTVTGKFGGSNGTSSATLSFQPSGDAQLEISPGTNLIAGGFSLTPITSLSYAL